jgi:hypothetical protein
MVLHNRPDLVHIKYDARYYGPYLVLGIINDKVLLIQDIKSKKTRYVNASHVKPYHPRMSGSSEGDLPLSEKNETSGPVTRAKAQQLSEDTAVTKELTPQVVRDEARYASQAPYQTIGGNTEVTILNPEVVPVPRWLPKTEQQEPMDQQTTDIWGNYEVKQERRSSMPSRWLTPTRPPPQPTPASAQAGNWRTQPPTIQLSPTAKYVNPDGIQRRMEWSPPPSVGQPLGVKRRASNLSPPEGDLGGKLKKLLGNFSPNKSVIRKISKPVIQASKITRPTRSNSSVPDTSLAPPNRPAEYKPYRVTFLRKHVNGEGENPFCKGENRVALLERD